MRVDNKNFPDYVRGRKQKIIKMSPGITIHCYVSLPNKHTPEYIDRLVQVGLIEYINLINGKPSGEFKSDHAVFIKHDTSILQT